MQYGPGLCVGLLKPSGPVGARFRGYLDGLLLHMLPMALAAERLCKEEDYEERGRHEVCPGDF